MLNRAIQFVILIALSASVLAANRVSVMVKPSAEVSGPNVVLSDIAGTSDKLGSVAICPSPLPGKARQLTRAQIMIALKRAGVYETIELLCPDQVSVVRTASTVSPEALLETARQFIQSSNDLTGTVSVEPVRAIAPQIVPSGKLEMRVKAGIRAIRKGQNNLPIEMLVDGRIYRMISVPVLVKVLATVPVATKAITRTEEISSASYSLQERDITTMPADIIIGEPESGWTAVVPIPEGSVLRRSWVSDPPAIRSGDVVSVVVTNGAVRISDKGTAVQEGRPGDLVKVRMLGDAREIRGTVAGPGVVQITMGRK